MNTEQRGYEPRGRFKGLGVGRGVTDGLRGHSETCAVVVMWRPQFRSEMHTSCRITVDASVQIIRYSDPVHPEHQMQCSDGRPA